MSDNNNDGLGLDDPDRLPWLETADGYQYDEGASPLKVAALVLGGLALLALIVGGIYWLQRTQNSGAQGNGELIAAQEGAYKVAPTDPEGKKFEGEGDSAFAASEGKKTGATIAPPLQRPPRRRPLRNRPSAIQPPPVQSWFSSAHSEIRSKPIKLGRLSVNASASCRGQTAKSPKRTAREVARYFVCKPSLQTPPRPSNCALS